MNNFWTKLKKPIYCLAPMEGVTDTAFRQFLSQVGKPDVMFTEFANVSAIFSPDKTSAQRLTFSPTEQPLVAQIWGLDPELFFAAAQTLTELGFAGIDLNFGCPVKDVIKKGACSALVNDLPLAKKIITSTIKGAGGKIPVSIKIRIGFDKPVTKDWVKFLLQFNLAAISIHGRTTKQLSKSSVDWDQIGEAVKVRNSLKSQTLIIGNGDIMSLKEADAKIAQYGLDGIMIGRGVFHDPLIFKKDQSFTDLSTQQKLDLLLTHAQVFTNTWGDQKPFYILRRFFKIYASGFPQALSLRIKLMSAANLEEVQLIISQFLA